MKGNRCSISPCDDSFLASPPPRGFARSSSRNRRRFSAESAIFSQVEALEERLLLTYAPVFNPEEYNFSVDEDAAIDTVIGQVQATDEDTQSIDLLYWLGEGSFRSPFYVDQSTGEIKVARELNYEWSDYEYLSIEATDPDWNSAYAWIEITINDVAEHPVFDEPSYAFSIAENAASGTIIDSVSATDPQDDPNDPQGNPLTYSLSMEDEGYGSLAGVKFEIDSETGEISFQGTLDYETAGYISLKAYAYDEDVNVTEVDVLVYVTDVADDPEFALGTYAFSIDENEPAQALGSVGATDPGDLDIIYTLDDGYENQAFSIDPNSGEISAKVSFNYELGSQYQITVFATNEDGVTSSAVVDVYINNIDETPGTNNPPVLSGLTFTMTEQKDGFAIGEIEGVITDDYVAEGYYVIEIDVYNDGEIDFTYEAPQGLSALWFETAISYGTHDIAVRISEFELETGSTLPGSWVTTSALATPPANAAPTVDNLNYERVDEGYGFGGIHYYLKGDITDATRGYSSYTIQFDMDGDGVFDPLVDDSVDVENDWETFVLDFEPDEGEHSINVRVIEHDYNIDTGYGGAALLVGDWEPLDFTVEPEEHPNFEPVIDSAYFTEGEEGYGGSLDGWFTDNVAPGGYRLEVETTGDTYTDEDIDSNVFSSYLDDLGLQPGETVTRVRIVEQVSGKASDWVAVDHENHAPVIASVANDLKFSVIYLEQDESEETAIHNGDEVVTITATDEDEDAIEYKLTQPRIPSKVTSISRYALYKNFVHRALDLNENTGLITINDRDILAKALRKDGKYTFTVTARDVPGNYNAKRDDVTVTIYDDWSITYDTAMSYVGDWKSDADTYVNQVYIKSVQALDKLDEFVDSNYAAFDSGTSTALGGIKFVGSALAKTDKAKSYVSIGVAAADLISKAIARAEKPRDEAVVKQIEITLEEVLDTDTTDIRHNRDNERNKLIALKAKTENNTPLDQRALQMMAQYETVKSTLLRTFDNGENLVAPPVNTIYGELLMQFAAKEGFRVVGKTDNILFTEKFYWGLNSRLFSLDGEDVAEELNEIDYRPLDIYYIRIQGGVVTRLTESQFENLQKNAKGVFPL